MIRYLRIFIILTSVFWASNLLAQDALPVYEMFEVEQAPSFPGAEVAMFQYIHRNFQAPTHLSTDNISGSIILASFIVDTLGQLTDARIIKDIGPGFGQEVLRILQTMPRWLPGRLGNQKVRVRFSLQLRLHLE